MPKVSISQKLIIMVGNTSANKNENKYLSKINNS